ncbi:MAG: hypothetical protein OEV43_02450 [Coriobacteriia bacterium]|nr:hypothetical protein [Coriobacteriia bacterium]
MRPSPRTVLLFVLGMGSITAIATVVGLEVGGPDGALAIRDLGKLAVIIGLAMVVLSAAALLPRRHDGRGAWAFIGIALLCVGIGDAVGTHIEIVQGREVPFPGAADVFRVAYCLLLFGGLQSAVRRYRARTSLAGAAWFSAASGALLLAVIWLTILQPYILADGGLSGGARFLSILYPVVDVMALFVPAMFMLLAAVRLGHGGAAMPWYALCSGVLVLVASDVGFSYLTVTDSYQAGAIVDYGWMFAYVLIAVGASLAHDLAQPRAQATRLAHESA